MKTKLAIILAALTLSILSCDAAKDVVNNGGDTTCREYLAQDKDEQQRTVVQLLKEEEGGNEEPTPEAVELGSAAVAVLCQIENNRETPIREADLQP